MQRVKRQRQPKRTGCQHGIHAGRRGREVAPLPPQQGMKPVEIAPQRCGDGGKRLRLRGATQRFRAFRQSHQQLFEEGGTGKVRRTRIGDLAAMRGGKGQQRLRAVWRRRRLRTSGDKGELRAAPRGLCAFGRQGEIFTHRLASINIAPVWQRLRPSGLQQVGGFQGTEVLAVDPQQIDGAMMLAPGAGFRLQALYRICGIGDMHNAQVDSIVAFHLRADPVEIAIYRRVAAPGIKPHRLSAGLAGDLLPAIVGVSGKRGPQQRREPE